jgi:carboxyl-terminal processing protease
LDREQYAAIQKFDLIGVGVTLMPNEEKQIIVGAPPVAGSASDVAGLQVGDYVVAVNGVETSGKSAFDIIDLISDTPNAPTVTMTIRRVANPNDLPGEGGTTVRQVTLDRKFQQVKDPIIYKISEERSDGTKVGYIQIAEFNSLVKAKLENAFKELQNKGANAFVLDLRGNPGGAFQSAVEISSLFVDNRVATYVVDSNGVELPFKTMADRVVVDPKAPVAIWVDGGSASASEVLAGSLNDNCRAVIMGKQSFGKGLIQAVYGLKNGAGLVLTVARYVTPNGTEIHGKGVTPDISGGVPLNLPIVGTDTSKVDFGTISNRLDPSMCQVPTPHGG